MRTKLVNTAAELAVLREDVAADDEAVKGRDELRARVASLEAELTALHQQCSDDRERALRDRDIRDQMIDGLQAELVAARSTVDRVRAVHERIVGGGDDAFCYVCSDHGDIDWPCRTVAAIDNTPYRCSLHGDACDGDMEQAHIMQPARPAEPSGLDPRSFDRPGQRAAARMLNADTDGGGE